MRKVISILGILALLATVVSADMGAAVESLACCNGIMCPMHQERSHAPDCSMDMNGSGAAWTPCPVPPAAQYTAATVFVLPGPVVLNRTIVTEPAVASLERLLLDAEIKIDPPPPRLQLTP